MYSSKILMFDWACTLSAKLCYYIAYTRAYGLTWCFIGHVRYLPNNVCYDVYIAISAVLLAMIHRLSQRRTILLPVRDLDINITITLCYTRSPANIVTSQRHTLSQYIFRNQGR